MFRQKCVCLQSFMLKNGIFSIQLQRNQTTTSIPTSNENEVTFLDTWNEAKQFKKIPGPSSLQMLFGFLPAGKYHSIELSDFNKIMHEEYGKILKLPAMLGNRGFILLSDPKDFELVFRNEGIWPFRRGMETFDVYRKKVRADLFKNYGGLISDQGEPWAKMRTIVNPILLKPLTVNSYVPVVDEIAIEFIERIKSLRSKDSETPANFGYELNKWSLESITAIALDQRLNVMNSSESNDSNSRPRILIDAIDEFFKLSYQLEVQPSLWRYFETPKYNRLMKTFDTMTATTLYYIDQAIEKLEKRSTFNTDDKEPSVLEKLLKIDKHVAMIMALDMMMAGVDTTSSAMVNILYHLAKNPEKQAKLREELKTVLPDPNGRLSPKSFLAVPYLRACIKETMRLTPITTGNARAAGRDLVIKGYQIPKGTDLVMSSLSKEGQYFREPTKFIPERWLKESMPDACPEAKSSNPFVHLPFGFGPRSCVGRRFAEMELNVLITRFVRQFNIEYNYSAPKYRLSFILSPVGDLKFKLIDI